MKITDIQIEVVERRLDHTGLDSDMGRFGGGVVQGVLRVLTDEGVEGNAFVGNFRQGGGRLFDPILSVLKPELVGRDPADREWLWSRLPLLRGRRGLSMEAWAPVDVALWDIAGKAAGVPIYHLLGARRRETEVYATYPPRHDTPDGYVEEAEKVVSRGFRAYKIHPGVMPARDVTEMVGRVRDSVGFDVRLMLDPNGGYGFRKALEIGRALDDFGFYWYEDPIPWHEYDAIAELSRRLDVPLCMSDQPELQFANGARLARMGAARLVRGTSAKLGITGLKKLCSLAEGFGLNCEIGTAGNALLQAANLHVIFSVDNCDFYEYWMPQSAHQFGLVEEIVLNERCTISAPTSPGLGYEVDWHWVRRHSKGTLE